MADLALPGLSDDEDQSPARSRRSFGGAQRDEDEPMGYQPWGGGSRRSRSAEAEQHMSAMLAADLGFSQEDLQTSEQSAMEPSSSFAAGPMQVDLLAKPKGRRLGLGPRTSEAALDTMMEPPSGGQPEMAASQSMPAFPGASSQASRGSSPAATLGRGAGTPVYGALAGSALDEVDPDELLDDILGGDSEPEYRSGRRESQGDASAGQGPPPEAMEPSGFEPRSGGPSMQDVQASEQSAMEPSASFATMEPSASFGAGGPLQVDLLAKPKGRRLGFGRRRTDESLDQLAPEQPDMATSQSMPVFPGASSQTAQLSSPMAAGTPAAASGTPGHRSEIGSRANLEADPDDLLDDILAGERGGGSRIGRGAPPSETYGSPTAYEAPFQEAPSILEPRKGGPLQVDLLAKPKGRRLGRARPESLDPPSSDPPEWAATPSMPASGGGQASQGAFGMSPGAYSGMARGGTPPPQANPEPQDVQERQPELGDDAEELPAGAKAHLQGGLASAAAALDAKLGLGSSVTPSARSGGGVSSGVPPVPAAGLPPTTPSARGAVPILGADAAVGSRQRLASPVNPPASPRPRGGTMGQPTDRTPTQSGTPRSEPPLSLPAFDAFPGVKAAAGFTATPPLTMAPSSDLLTKLAYSEAKVKHLEAQLGENEERWTQRLADAKQASDAEHERLELQCRRLEAELDRQKTLHAEDLQQVNETKQARVQQMEKIMADNEDRCARRLEEARKEHERMDLQCRRLEAELERQKELHASVLRHVNEAKQVDRSVEWSVRERQLEIRERGVAEREAYVSKQAKDVEEQWQRVSEMNRHMEESQKDERQTSTRERERLEAEHTRLLELQKVVREADRNNKDASKHAWAQLEDERRTFTQERLQVDAELNARREEIELQERQVRSESERLKGLHVQVENARQNASRRIRESEAVVTSERRCLLNDLEVFEEKQKNFSKDVAKFEAERQKHDIASKKLEEEMQDVGRMAAEVQRRSEELKTLHAQVSEAHSELQRLRDQLQDERAEHGNEFEKLRTMQTVVEQQRLQLLQTENDIRLRAIEDVELLTSAQAQSSKTPEPEAQVLALTSAGENAVARASSTAPTASGVHQPMRAYYGAMATSQQQSVPLALSSCPAASCNRNVHGLPPAGALRTGPGVLPGAAWASSGVSPYMQGRALSVPDRPRAWPGAFGAIPHSGSSSMDSQEDDVAGAPYEAIRPLQAEFDLTSSSVA